MYTPIAIANWFINKAIQERTPLDQLKLMKLTYIAQGCALACDKRLFDEPIEAWAYGPVIRSLRKAFAKYGMNQILKPHEIDYYENGELKRITLNVKEEDIETQDLLSKVWDAFGGYSGVKLSNWTHEEQSPWTLAVKDQSETDEFNNPIISELLIKNYFNQMVTC